MLNLELLEKQLDEVLAKETHETMTSWLFDRRLKKYVSSLGDGLFANIPSKKLEIKKNKEHLIPNNNIVDFSQNVEIYDHDYYYAA